MGKLSEEQKARMQEGRKRRRESGEPPDKPTPSYFGSVKSRAMREFCMECVCGQRKEIELCTSMACPLYPFRLGANPFAGRSVRYYLADLKRRREDKAKQIGCQRESIYGLGKADETDEASNGADEEE